MRRRIYTTLMAAILLIVAVFTLSRTQTSATPQQPTLQWPAFTMVYTQSFYGLGLDGAMGTQRIQLTYDDVYHWRTEVLSHSAVPEIVGYWATYDGTEIRSYDPRTQQETVNNVIADGGIQLPDAWIRPDYIPNLLTKPNVVHRDTAAGSEGELELTEQVGCVDPPTNANHADLDPCSSAYREATRHIRYRNTDFIPLEIIDTLDGVVTQTITVESLTIR